MGKGVVMCFGSKIDCVVAFIW